MPSFQTEFNVDLLIARVPKKRNMAKDQRTRPKSDRAKGLLDQTKERLRLEFSSDRV